MKPGTIVRRLPYKGKYGTLPTEATKVDWVILQPEDRDGELWYRCNTVKNLARAGKENDEWGRLCTVKTDSTIFLPEEIVETGRIYPL